MKLNSIGKTLGTTLSATAIAALTLSGCGSDNNAGTAATTGGNGTASASAECGGKGSITAEGSTAQQNAIAEFNKVWGQVCSGKNLSYNPTGSGAGIKQFIAGQVDFAGSDSALKTEEQDARGRRGRAAAATRPGTCRWSPARSRSPTTSRASTSSSSTPRSPPRSSRADHHLERPGDRRAQPRRHAADADIKVFFRSDESGTTENFPKYLNAAAPQAWTGRRQEVDAARVRARRSPPVSPRP